MLKKISFEGQEFEYDPAEAKSYKNLKRIARGGNDIQGFFDAFEDIFAGKDVEYADALGNDFEKLGALVTAVVEAEGSVAKN